ncbi:MAG: GNAT family N-acetyltransferase [Chitinophagaceae bacterium]
MIRLKRTDNNDPDFKQLVEKLDKDLWSRYGQEQQKYAPHNKLEYLDTVVIAYAYNIPAGCGCLKKFDTTTAEVKRMFVEEDQRRKGVAAAILNELEGWAKELNYANTILDTGNNQPEAIGLYKKAGYLVMKNYAPYTDMPEITCMTKSLMEEE